MDDEFSTNASKTAEKPTTYDLFILVLAIFTLIGLVLVALVPLGPVTKQHLHTLSNIIALVFMFDFFRNLYIAPSKTGYLKWGWLDFLGGIPLNNFAIFRLARVYRVLRILRKTESKVLLARFRDNLAEDTLFFVLLLATLAISIGSFFVLIFERGTPGSNIETPQDAIWWAIVTVSTVGYGDCYPVTTNGRILATFLILIGISVFGVLGGFLAHEFISISNKKDQEDQEDEEEEEEEPTIADLQKDIADIKVDIETIKQWFEKRD